MMTIASGSTAASLAQGFVFDTREMDRLRAKVQQSPDGEAAQREVAQQFEALFINMLIQRMRDATPSEGLFDNEQTRMMQSLADQQIASDLASKQSGLGLAEALLRQIRQPGSAMADVSGAAGSVSGRGPGGTGELTRELRVDGSLAPTSPTLQQNLWRGARAGVAAVRAGAAFAGRAPMLKAAAQAPDFVASFVEKLAPMAQRIAQESGIPAQLILGQAALESGWGRREIRHEDGSPSHNLFGIKATPAWRGAVVETMTTEYEDGKARKLTQPFRAYSSYEDALRDYAGLLQRNERYQGVLQASDPAEAARRIQEAGYATDPGYADKLINVMAMLER
ncbi:flagellar assembly peptidoglycan hydrolase FlgJ, partial [Pseudomonas sp. S 311-6]|nr:flagellar assembly peptidoglycan hydrolase FlgJ [Pseudomonas sp. S 311-6]